MEGEKLNIAFCGLNPKGIEVLSVVASMADCRVVAVCGSDREQTERTALRYECLGFSDLRQLVLKTKPDILVVSSHLQPATEILNVAIENRVNILKVPPAAIDFATCTELVNSAATQKICFVTANLCRFSPGFAALQEYLKANPQDRAGTYFIEAVGKFATDTSLGDNRWLCDPQLAGGGVLLRDCYNLIQEIVINFGLPEYVYAMKTNLAPDKTQRLSLTEDCATVSIRFSDKLLGNIIANRVCHKNELQIRLYCADKSISVSPASLRINDLDGNLISETSGPDDNAVIYEKIIADIARQIKDKQYESVLADERQTLMTMAFIEACYLSSRTAMPENPEKLLKINKAENSAVIWNNN